MKRFAFRLEQVRKWREDQAALEEMRLQMLCAELRAAETEQARLERESENLRRSVLAQRAVPAEDFPLLERDREYAARELRRVAAKKRDLQGRIREQRQRAIEAHRGFRLLDSLRDKALLTWTAARDKEQEGLAAELYLAKMNRDA